MSNTGKQQFFANQLSDKDRSVPNYIDLDRPIYIVKTIIYLKYEVMYGVCNIGYRFISERNKGRVE